jgi:hypothetical protein
VHNISGATKLVDRQHRRNKDQTRFFNGEGSDLVSAGSRQAAGPARDPGLEPGRLCTFARVGGVVVGGGGVVGVCR